MAKQINLEWDGKPYTLEFTRRTVAQLEREGFRGGDMGDKPLNMVPVLFAGAFRAHHPYVKKDVTDAIWKACPDKYGLIDKLSEMYNEPVDVLMEQPEDDAKKVEWVTNW